LAQTGEINYGETDTNMMDFDDDNNNDNDDDHHNNNNNTTTTTTNTTTNTHNDNNTNTLPADSPSLDETLAMFSKMGFI
jgi:hypothetical protein